MLERLIRPLRESFSAKIITLVSASVVVTSLVVGIVTVRSTKSFLTDKTIEKFPSRLLTSTSTIKIFYERQQNILFRLSESGTFRDNLENYQMDGEENELAEKSVEELNKYLKIVHNEFEAFEDLVILSIREGVLASTNANVNAEADSMLNLVGEGVDGLLFSPVSLAYHEANASHWIFADIGGNNTDGTGTYMGARINLKRVEAILGDIRIGNGGDMYLLDNRGRYITRPRFATQKILGDERMQVPTRDEGKAVVEKRESYENREVFSSISMVENTGWWLVYEEDYKTAMEPVLNTQKRMWLSVLLVGAVFIFGANKIVRSLMRPVHALKLGAERINDGLVGVKIQKGTNDEIGMMIDTFNEMAKKITLSQAELQYKNKVLNSQNDELQRMNLKLEELSITDGLTGLFNHRHFWNILNTELSRASLYKGDLALLLVDLDDFKRVNDRFGHSVGDQLLQTVAGILKETVRDTDIVARYGGEEFAILLPDTNREGMTIVSEKLRSKTESMRFKVPETDINISVTISVGVSVFKGNRRKFFNAADMALYKSKTDGKNRVSHAPV